MQIMLDFNNTQIAFSAKSDKELQNAYVLFNTIKRPGLVRFLKWCSNVALKIHFPLGWAVKPTLYKQFVGGETLENCDKILEDLRKFGVRGALDYSAECKQTPEGITATFKETINSIDNAARNPNVVFAVFKPSTITTDEVLAKASEKREPLTETEAHEFAEFKERFIALCRHAELKGVRILVDAEDYCFQDAIDELSDECMREFNKERPIVFATLQMYRHDRMPYLERIYQDAKEKGYKPGIKFVRGAYMEEERKRAVEMGYPDPICKDKQETDRNFDEGVRFVVERIETFELFMGTHNERSNYYLAELIDKHGLARGDERIWFSQLLGMSDNISFNLAAEGYNVLKYIPYAKVRDVIPYLMRRATENTSVAGQTGRELSMIKAEKERRAAEKRR